MIKLGPLTVGLAWRSRVCAVLCFAGLSCLAFYLLGLSCAWAFVLFCNGHPLQALTGAALTLALWPGLSVGIVVACAGVEALCRVVAPWLRRKP